MQNKVQNLEFNKIQKKKKLLPLEQDDFKLEVSPEKSRNVYNN